MSEASNDQPQSPFNVVGRNSAPINRGEEIRESGDGEKSIEERIKALINSSPVFLFMKGNPSTPMCGFSSNVVSILNRHQVPFKTFDILQEPAIRSGVKAVSNWPTFPQLYIKGKLVGGNDIVAEMDESGDLAEILPN